MSRCQVFSFFYFLYLHNTRCGLHFRSLSSSFRRMSCACTHRKILPAIMPRNVGCISPRARSRGNLLTFFLSDEKESKQRKNRRHRFIGRFFLYTDSVNLNTLFPPCLLNYMAFSSSHPVLIQKPRRSPLRRGKLLLYVIAVNTLCL